MDTVDTTTTESSSPGAAGYAKQGLAVFAAIGGVIMTINACCALYDRITKKPQPKKTPEEEEEQVRARARIYAEEQAKFNLAAKFLDQMDGDDVKKVIQDALGAVAENPEPTSNGKAPKKAAKKAAKRTTAST